MNVNQYFNPSKKVEFKLFINDTLIQSGYVKLTDIKYNGINKWRYEIVLFGELGNFLGQFEDTTLKDILTSYKNNYIQFSNTTPLLYDKTYTLMNLWNANLSGNTSRESLQLDYLYNNDINIDRFFSGDTRNVYLDLVDAENGLSDEGKTIMYSGGFEILTTQEPYTEQQLCLKNEIEQRLGFYNDKLLSDILRSYGYTIDNIGGEWINKNNPYWYNTLTTTIIPKTIDDSYNLTISGTTSYNSKDTSYSDFDYYTFIPNPSYISNSSLGFNLGVNSSYTYTYYPNNIDFEYKPIKVSDIFPNKFIASYTRDNSILNSGIFTLSGLTNNFLPYYPEETTEEDWFEIKVGWVISNSAQTNQDIYFEKTIILTTYSYDDNITRFLFRVNAFDFFYLEIYDESKEQWVKLDDFIYGLTNTINITKNPYYNNQNFSIVYSVKKSKKNLNLVSYPYAFSMSDLDLIYTQTPFTYSIKSNQNIEQGSLIRYWDLLPKTKSIDFILSHLKMNGLFLDINNDTKKIKILTRNEYFTDNILDWDDKLCLDKDIQLVPLNFDKKFIKLSYLDSDTKLCENYKNKYNKSYGEQILNTGYEFNNDVYNMFDNIIYSNYISVSQDRDIYGYNSDPKVIPHLYKDELIKSKKSEKIYLVFNSPYYETNRQVSKIPYYDGTGYTNGGMYFGFFNNGIYQTNNNAFKINGYNLMSYNITNDNLGNLSLTFLPYSKNYTVLGPSVDSNYSYKPTNHYYPSHKNITHSLDFGRPLELYHNNEYNSGTTIYDRLWKKYLEDRYNVNTKILTAYFYLNDIDFNNFNFGNFIFLKNKYWVVNKIIDYNLIWNQPVKVELISVNDINNYINGQNINIDPSLLTKIGESGATSIVNTGGYDIIRYEDVIEYGMSYSSGSSMLTILLDEQFTNMVTSGSSLIPSGWLFATSDETTYITTGNTYSVEFHMGTNPIINVLLLNKTGITEFSGDIVIESNVFVDNLDIGNDLITISFWNNNDFIVLQNILEDSVGLKSYLINVPTPANKITIIVNSINKTLYMDYLKIGYSDDNLIWTNLSGGTSLISNEFDMSITGLNSSTQYNYKSYIKVGNNFYYGDIRSIKIN